MVGIYSDVTSVLDEYKILKNRPRCAMMPRVEAAFLCPVLSFM
jgi:hypothetical protein